MRILIIGSLPPPKGGTGISLLHLTELLNRRKGIETSIINTSSLRSQIGVERFALGGSSSVAGKNRWKDLWGIAQVALEIFRESGRADVISLHVNTTSVHSLGLFCWIVSRLRKRAFVLRKFAGTSLNYLGGVRSAVAWWVVAHCDLYLAQTQSLLKEAREGGVKRVAWFPTNRPMSAHLGGRPLDRRGCRRFVFLGLVGIHKGIKELIEAAEMFDSEVSVDVFGPFVGDVTESLFEGRKRIRYRGILETEEVEAVLSTYDALVLPTFHPGEGYPGVIIEAYSAGIPVVTTRWMAIPEIVDDTCGILVEPRSSTDLFRGMMTLVQDEKLYDRVCAGAVLARGKFDADTWSERFVNFCQEALSNRGSRTPTNCKTTSVLG